MSLRPGAVNFQEKWSGLQETISAVVKLNSVKTATWNDHYSDIYALCEAFPKSFAETLYKETKALLIQFVAKLLETLSCLTSQPLLTAYQQHWLRYHQGTKYLDNLFSYFNRVPLRKYQPHQNDSITALGVPAPPPAIAPGTDSPIQIRHMALGVWKSGLLEHIREKLLTALLEEVQRERTGQSADLSMVRDVVGSFIEVEEAKTEGSLRYYQEHFEAQFLTDTGHHYRQLASQMMAELACSDYIKQVVVKLQSARRSGSRFLHSTSITKFIRECEARLVVDYMEDYLYPHMQDMIHQEKHSDLSNLYTLLNGIPKALQPAVRTFGEHVKNQGALALQQLQQNKAHEVTDFVEAVLCIHSKYHSMVTSLFSGHKDFTAALDRACKAFVNVPEKPRQHPKAPILLARYCDLLLRKSSKVAEEVEDRLENAITVFRYIEDKDMFQRFYSRMLSRRVVQGLSLSMEAEESMIFKLKHACGYEYTARLQRMILDISLSADTNAEFQEYLATRGQSLPISFSSMVLQSAAWPLQRSTCSVHIPTHLHTAMKKFEEFYISTHSGRVLSWLHHLSLAELQLKYLKKFYTVSVSTYQMLILLAFNQSETNDVPSLAQFTQLSEQELSRTLQSLLDSKLLLLEGAESELSSVSTVKLNKSYSNKRTKFKITAIFQKDSQHEVEQTLYNVTEDRKLHIQAAIVRVMKARKVLQHNQLIQEVISQVRSRFIPNIQMIKRCIETLMEKQYLERVEDTRDTYSYMA